MAISLPTSADVRKARSQVNKAVNTQVDAVRTPVLAWLGATDLAVQTLRELPAELRTRLSRDELRKRADEASERARGAYDEWAERGEGTLERIRKQAQVARALRAVESADKRSSTLVEKLVDELHEVGEEVLEAVSFETRSAGERTARRTQRVANEAAATVTELSTELAGTVREAGTEAARTTRGTTRKAASRTAPAKASTSNTTRTNNNRRTNSAK
jgi:heparin binding hemagglutinin HbhA